MSTRTTNPFAYPKPITLDTLDDLFAHHAGNLAGWRMDGGDGGTGGDNGGQGGGDNGGTGNAGTGDTGTGTGGTDTGRSFTQADLDRVVTERIAAEKRKHDRELEQARTDAGKSDTQRLEVERDRAVEQGKAASTKAAEKVANALAQVGAIAAGGRPDRAAAIVRQADLDGVAKFDGDDFTIDESRLTDAIGKVLTEYPEWKADAGDAGKGKGDDAGKGGDEAGKGKHGDASGGDLGGGRSGEVTLDAFKRMNMTERGKLAAEDPDAYRRLADAEIDGNSRHTR